ncbi:MULTISPECIES: hypothetical protein [Bacillaceae]|uniref:hypothetical protein n=1 Tax=Bacillaceae TaxID=186817 RepID=UPI001187FBC5|nr:hypothetical protein [Bacillus sp. S3]QCJ43252.1 hypothetical protein FAY30_15840 [Bacillus sp. S3]
MRILLIILAVFIPSGLYAKAETTISSQVEGIDLNIKEHQAAVTFLGLSAGEATLIQGSNGENILVNFGGKGTKAELEGWLSLYNVKEISTLILTNDGHELSFNKINDFIEKYKIKKIITTPEISALLTENLDQSNQISVMTWGMGDQKEILPEMTAVVQFIGNHQHEGMDLMLNFFEHNIFLMTSTSQRAEQSLLKKDLKDVNVFKIPNSKLENPISDELIQNLNPQISILFTAEEHHPNPNILHDLHGIWSEVYSTKKHGTISIKFTDSNYEVITIPVEEKE